MWGSLMSGVAVSLLFCGVAHAETGTNNEMLANLALHALHSLAVEGEKSANSTKDSDDLGCKYANKSIEESAHEALDDMHSMSFTPIDAVGAVSELLRLDHLAQPNGCSFDEAAKELPLIAGQAIMSLRWDYAIGNEGWYTIESNGEIRNRNPLSYAESLIEQSYSWVSTRPKGMMFIIEEDWKSEMASDQVDDASIKNSGSNLQTIEVDYRQRSKDNNSEVFFYRTKDDAVAALQVEKEEAKNDATADEKQKAIDSEWGQKLKSLPYMVASQDVGFKLIYAVCKADRKSAKGSDTCHNDGSHDWSDDRHAQYRWFSDIQACEDAEVSINVKHPPGIKVNADDGFTADCVPASKVSVHSLTGYRMVISILAPGSASDRASYAYVRRNASEPAITFRSFNACYNTIINMYGAITKDLKIDDDGNLLSDKTKSISLIANCVRFY